MAVLTPHPHRRVYKLPLILGGMALEAGFGISVFGVKVRVVGGLKIRVVGGVSSRNFANPRHPNSRCDEKE